MPGWCGCACSWPSRTPSPAALPARRHPASRKSLSVEIGKYRCRRPLILADALALADEEAPARWSLRHLDRRRRRPQAGPATLHARDTLAADLGRIGDAVNDPVWRMPLWPPYDSLLGPRSPT
jgi:leucyl aminopeptidase